MDPRLTIIPPASPHLPWTVRGYGHDRLFDTRDQAEAWTRDHAGASDMDDARRREAIIATARACDLTDDEQSRILQYQALTRLIRRHGWLEPIQLSDTTRPLIIAEGKRFGSFETFARHTLGETVREDA